MTTIAARWTAVRNAITLRREREREAALVAEAAVAADEATVTRRSSWTLGRAWREFWGHPSPWIITAVLGGSLGFRLAAGQWMWTDLLVPVVMVASFPVVEWVVHVTILHYRPRTVAGVTIDPLVSRKHREHHADPRDIPLVFIPWQVLLVNLTAGIAVATLVFDRLPLGLTYLVTLAAIGFVYEWTHYLIHTDYRPVGSLYRSLWRNHRLHHYKNEHYWFTVTTAHTSDRLFRTDPDPSEIETSPTVRALHATSEVG